MSTSSLNVQSSTIKVHSVKEFQTHRGIKRQQDFDPPSSGEDKKPKIIQEKDYANVILRLYQAKEYSKCLETVEDFFACSSSSNVSHFQIIQAACWTNLSINGDRVFSSLNQIIKSEPKNSFAHYALGMSHYQAGDFHKSVESFETAVEINPTPSMKIAMECQAKAQCLIELFEKGEDFFCLLS